MNELEIIRYAQIDGLRLFLNTVDYRTPHLHSEWELIWVLEHPLSVNCGQKHYRVEPGQLILLNPNEPHEFQKVDGSCTFACIQVSAKLLPVSPRLYADDCFPHKYLSTEEFEDLKQQFLDMLRVYLRQEKQYALYCVGQCCMMFYRLLSAMPGHELTPAQAASMDKRTAMLKRLVQFVEENHMRKIKLSDFAGNEGYSVSYLSHYVKDRMNQTFQEYVTTVRLNSARRAITAGGKRMLDICMESGFSDYRYFCKAFRKQYGMTPEAYRRHNYKNGEQARLGCSMQSEERFYSIEDSLAILEAFYL